MDQRVWLRAADRSLARSPDPSCPHSRNEWRQLSARTEQAPLPTLPTVSVVRRDACKITPPSLDTTTNDRAHRGKKDDSSMRALAVKPRACGAPLRGFG